MDLNKNNKKALFLTDIDLGLEPFFQKETNIELKDMLNIQIYGPLISNPYGDIMRSIIIAIYQENIEEIFVVGIEDKENVSIDLKSLLDPEGKQIRGKLETMDYLFKNCMPEFMDGSLKEWIENKNEKVAESVQKSIEMIRQHPLIPSYVKVKGLIVNKKGDFQLSIND